MTKIVGYTTGVFDLFHVGHLNILKKAKSLCDELIVGVCTDELCSNIKNKTPVIPFEERVKIIEAIKYVDRVIPQNDIDEIADHNRLGFQRIFKGGDWRDSEKWNELEQKFSERNVEVIYFDYTENTSSSLIRAVLEAMNAVVNSK
jgi:glycerol-3-phosphate cytidylyltransferase